MVISLPKKNSICILLVDSDYFICLPSSLFPHTFPHDALSSTIISNDASNVHSTSIARDWSTLWRIIDKIPYVVSLLNMTLVRFFRGTT